MGIAGLFTKKIGPVFLKESSDAVLFVEKMKELAEETSGNEKEDIEKQIKLADFFLQCNQTNKSDYAKRYEAIAEVAKDIAREKMEDVGKTVGDETLINQLKAFRLEQSRKENIKPYYIFNDAQMNDLIQKSPKTKEQLLKVNGFGTVKVEKYGDIILKILNGEKY